jgi:hypothetical protein
MSTGTNRIEHTMTDEQQRDELAEIIQDVGEYIPGSHADDYISPNKAADAILAAGYTKQTPSTEAEEAMTRIGTALEAHYAGKLDANATLNWIAQIRGAYIVDAS